MALEPASVPELTMGLLIELSSEFEIATPLLQAEIVNPMKTTTQQDSRVLAFIMNILERVERPLVRVSVAEKCLVPFKVRIWLYCNPVALELQRKIRGAMTIAHNVLTYRDVKPKLHAGWQRSADLLR